MMILLSILLLTLSFPTAFGNFILPDMGFLVWIGWLPALLHLRNSEKENDGRVGFLVCLGYYLFSQYWLFFAMANFGNIPPFTSILLVFLVALLFATWGGLAFAFAGVLRRKLHIPTVIALPLLWALTEFLRGHFPFGGNPWSAFAYALGKNPFAMQVSEWTGPYGLSALILLVNLGLVEAIRHRRIYPTIARKHALFAFVVFTAIHSLGYARFREVDIALSKIKTSHAPVSIAMIQGNISQDEKWDYRKANRIRDRYRLLSEGVWQSGGNPIVIWPEAAYPKTIERGAPLPWFSEWMKDGHTLLLGAITSEPGEDLDKSYNSALWIEGTGKLQSVSDKVHLVPFGEYVPMREILSFAQALTQSIGNFYPGKGGAPIDTRFGKFGILICYEDVFPEISRALLKSGAEILVNLTNDAWYEKSSAASQHLVYSQFRALESRRYLLRSTNTGMTAIIDPAGRVISELPWYEEGILKGEVFAIKPGEI